MKKLSLIVSALLFLVLLASCGGEKDMGEGVLEYEPEKPMPGGTLEIEYDVEDGPLKGSENIEMVAYFYTSGMPEATSVQYTDAADDEIEAELNIPEDANGIILKFTANGMTDNNNGLGYFIHLFDREGNPVAGTYAGLAEAKSYWGKAFADIDRDYEGALNLFDQEFEANPDLKDKYFSSYIAAIKLSGNDSLVQAELDNVRQKENPSVEELNTLTKWYNRVYNDDLGRQYVDALIKREPEGVHAQNERIQEITKMEGEELYKAANEFVSKYDEEAANRLHYSIEDRYRRADNVEKYIEYANNVEGAKIPLIMNEIAWTFAEKGENLDEAAGYAKTAIEESRKKMENAGQNKPKQYTTSEYKQNLAYELGMILDTYGNILAQQDKEEEALDAYAEAVELMKGENPEINENYASMLIANNKYDKAMSEIEKFIKEGAATDNMKGMLKTAYTESKGSVEGFEEYYQPVKEQAKGSMQDELKSKMMSKEAPAFTLTDLEGNEVSLADYKGKVVVLDFWATWCGPCLKSFPGMQKAVQEYEGEDVKFLFVNAWERVDDKKQNAEQFIQKNNYPFHVLLDLENKVIGEYKVQGIPTKYIIGPDGNIRFESVGFSGSAEQLVEELGMMIEMARQDKQA